MYAVYLFIIPPLALIFLVLHKDSSENRKTRLRRMAAVEETQRALVEQMVYASKTASALLDNEVNAEIAECAFRRYNNAEQMQKQFVHAQAMFAQFIMLIMTQQLSMELVARNRQAKRRGARLLADEYERRGADIDTLYRRLKQMGVSVDRYEQQYANR